MRGIFFYLSTGGENKDSSGPSVGVGIRSTTTNHNSMLTPSPQRPVQYEDVNQVILCRYKLLMETSNVMLSASGKMRTIVRSFEVRPLGQTAIRVRSSISFSFSFSGRMRRCLCVPSPLSNSLVHRSSFTR